MRLAKVTGTVVATSKYFTMTGTKLLLIQPLTFDLKEKGKPLVAMDTLEAGPGDTVFFVEAREASVAYPQAGDSGVPVDAGITGIVDSVNYVPYEKINK